MTAIPSRSPGGETFIADPHHTAGRSMARSKLGRSKLGRDRSRWGPAACAVSFVLLPPGRGERGAARRRHRDCPRARAADRRRTGMRRACRAAAGGRGAGFRRGGHCAARYRSRACRPRWISRRRCWRPTSPISYRGTPPCARSPTPTGPARASRWCDTMPWTRRCGAVEAGERRSTRHAGRGLRAAAGRTADVLAGSGRASCYAARTPGARVLADRYGRNVIALAVRKRAAAGFRTRAPTEPWRGRTSRGAGVEVAGENGIGEC